VREAGIVETGKGGGECVGRVRRRILAERRHSTWHLEVLTKLREQAGGDGAAPVLEE
jgi:hypothetical protein